MSFIHYLFLGHFKHDGEMVVFAKSPSDPVYRPVVCRPLDSESVAAVLQEATGIKGHDKAFPEDWMIWWEDGYLVCDKYTKNREVIDFVVRLVKRTHCDIHDVGAHCDLTLHDWLAVTHSYAKP